MTLTPTQHSILQRLADGDKLEWWFNPIGWPSSYYWLPWRDKDKAARSDSVQPLILAGFVTRTDEDWWGSVWEITERGRQHVESQAE